MTDGVCPFAVQVNVNGIDASVITSGYVDRVGFCDHAAGGFWTTLDDAGFWLRQGVSVHFGIARDGRIAQVANIFDTAWAEGRIPDDSKVSWPPYNTMGRRNPNGYLISTEHEDWEMVNGVSRAVSGSQWTEAEYAADLRVKRWCIDEVKRVAGKDLMRFGIDSLTSHHMFDPRDRAECAGKYWREQYKGRLWLDLTGGITQMNPTQIEQIEALLALAHFIRCGWNLADLSAEDKAAIKYAAALVPG